MAHIEAQALGGYYPTPERILPALADLVEIPTPARGTFTVLDPCAGTGAALVNLAQHWFGNLLNVPNRTGLDLRLLACELEASRAAACSQAVQRLLGWRAREDALEGDAFNATWASSSSGASLGMLNPPYQPDAQFGRLEQKFLARFTTALRPGSGILLFLVPHYALAASADYLAAHYEQVSVYRFPAGEYEAFRQVVVVGVRRADSPQVLGGGLSFPDEALAARLRQIAADASGVPALGEVSMNARPILAPGVLSEWSLAPVDLEEVRASFRPWCATPAGRASALPNTACRESWEALFHRHYPVALPLRPVHIAIAMAAGIFNGQRLSPTTPGLPPLLIKGVFEKEFRTVEVRKNKKGEATTAVQVQQPVLRVMVLDLERYEYHEVPAESEPTGSLALAEMTVADLLTHYGEAMIAVMRAQCPPWHDPANPAHQLVLPALKRPLFAAQRDAAQVALQELARGGGALVQGEMSTGKTSIGLQIAWSLRVAVAEALRAQFTRRGVPTAHFRPVRRALILCPPHLLSTWREEIETVLPAGVAVHELRTISDVEAVAHSTAPELEILLLSREDAKLGYAVAGVAAPAISRWAERAAPLHLGFARCPRCGTLVSATSEQMARGRLRCGHRSSRPLDLLGAQAVRLAGTLARYAPEEPRVRVLQPGRYAQTQRTLGRPLATDPEALQDMLRTLVQPLLAETCARFQARRYTDGKALVHTLILLALALPPAERASRLVDGQQRLLAALSGDRTPYGEASTLRDEVGRMVLLLAPGGVQQAEHLLVLRQHLTALDPRHALPGGLEQAAARLQRQKRGQPLGNEQQHHSHYQVQAAPGQAEGALYELRLRLDHGQPEQLITALPPTTEEVVARAKLILGTLGTLGRFERSAPCNEPLYQAVAQPPAARAAPFTWRAGYPAPGNQPPALSPAPRKMALARFIQKQHPHLFDLLILDETHEYAHDEAAQSRAAARLRSLAPTVAMTGTLSSGYASSVFRLMWLLFADMRARFGYHDQGAFVERFGYFKQAIDVEALAARVEVEAFGSRSDRVIQASGKRLGEAPGILPLFLLQHLLPHAAILTKADLDVDLPPRAVIPVAITPDPEQVKRYEALQRKVVQQIGQDRGKADLAGALFGALGELPSFLDRCTADTGNGAPRWEVRYPARLDSKLVATEALFPARWRGPKEEKLLELLAEELAEERNVVIYLRHTGKGTGLVERLAHLIQEATGEAPAILDAAKVTSRKRQDWIRQQVARGTRVLLANAETVKTGLNALCPHFATAIWYENPDCDAITFRQANDRLHRIGAIQAVRIFFLYYEATAQALQRGLLGSKVSASQQTDGVDIRSALEAAGAGARTSALYDSMSIGQALYLLLTEEGQRGGGSPEPRRLSVEIGIMVEG